MRLGSSFVLRFCAIVDGQRPGAPASAHRCRCTLAITSSGSGAAAEVGERGVHAVAQILRGVDQRAIEIENQQL